MRINLTCVQCGKSFERDSWEVNRGKTKYCSLSCFHLSLIGQERPALRRRITKVCPVCRKKFETGGRVGRVSKVFCSNKCARLARFRRGQSARFYQKQTQLISQGFWMGKVV